MIICSIVSFSPVSMIVYCNILSHGYATTNIVKFVTNLRRPKLNEFQNHSFFALIYLFAMKSPVTKQKYQKRLEKFFDFLQIEVRTIEEKSKVFIKKDCNGFFYSRLFGFVIEVGLARCELTAVTWTSCAIIC